MEGVNFRAAECAAASVLQARQSTTEYAGICPTYRSISWGKFGAMGHYISPDFRLVLTVYSYVF